MQTNLANESFEERIVAINNTINEIKYIQKYQIILGQKCNAVLIKKVSKLQEYNEISDMTNQIFEQRISNIEITLNELVKKLSA